MPPPVYTHAPPGTEFLTHAHENIKHHLSATTHPYKHVHIAQNYIFFALTLVSMIIAQLYFFEITEQLRLQLIVVDIDRQSKYTKMFYIQDKYCRQIDLHVTK